MLGQLNRSRYPEASIGAYCKYQCADVTEVHVAKVGVHISSRLPGIAFLMRSDTRRHGEAVLGRDP